MLLLSKWIPNLLTICTCLRICFSASPTNSSFDYSIKKRVLLRSLVLFISLHRKVIAYQSIILIFLFHLHIYQPGCKIIFYIIKKSPAIDRDCIYQSRHFFHNIQWKRQSKRHNVFIFLTLHTNPISNFSHFSFI